MRFGAFLSKHYLCGQFDQRSTGRWRLGNIVVMLRIAAPWMLFYYNVANLPSSPVLGLQCQTIADVLPGFLEFR